MARPVIDSPEPPHEHGRCDGCNRKATLEKCAGCDASVCIRCRNLCLRCLRWACDNCEPDIRFQILSHEGYCEQCTPRALASKVQGFRYASTIYSARKAIKRHQKAIDKLKFWITVCEHTASTNIEDQDDFTWEELERDA